MQYGIAIRNVCVRTEPTMEPLRKRKGDVWDRRQESRLLIGEGIQLKQVGAGWLYAVSDSTEGYVKEDGIRICSKRQYQGYQRKLVKEHQIVLKAGRDIDGRYLRVGTILPLCEANGAPVLCRNNAPVMVRNYLPYTERQMHLQVERMLDIPYSWGDERMDGMDCSSTVRGFYACFGLFLPRNAEEQRQYGEVLYSMNQADYEDLEGMASKEKLKIIRDFGVGTILHMPGHVVIYAGEKDGKPLVFHNCDTYGYEGEKETIVRKCSISEFLPRGKGTYLECLTAAWKPIL